LNMLGKILLLSYDVRQAQINILTAYEEMTRLRVIKEKGGV